MSRTLQIAVLIATLVPSLAVAESLPEFIHLFQIDAQEAFWEPIGGRRAGPLATKGSGKATENVFALSLLASRSGRIKATSGKDSHLEIELRDATQVTHLQRRGERPPLPAHAMKDRLGHTGAQRILVASAFAKSQRIAVPHYAEVEGQNRLALVPFNMDSAQNAILDPKVEVILEKNGPKSNDVWSNPHTGEIVSKIHDAHPTQKTIFMYGVAVDVCLRSAMEGALRRGYNVVLIEDASSGLTEERSKSTITELTVTARQSGVGFRTIPAKEIFREFGYSSASSVIASLGKDFIPYHDPNTPSILECQGQLGALK